MNPIKRRKFLRDIGISAATLPFLTGLPSLALGSPVRPRQRMVIMFSPNGTIPDNFWPDEEGENFTLKRILKPLEPYKDRMLTLNGVCNKIKGDGDRHMRGMSCLLTGTKLLPGNIQGGSDTPAGWASGISIDQEIKNYLQSQPETRTRFGSLEFGVGVPDRADPWTRMSYAGPNRPIAPTDNPYEMYRKLYGSVKDREVLGSVLGDVREDLKKVRSKLSEEDRRLLEEHEQLVSQMERDLEESKKQQLREGPPELEVGVSDRNESVPKLSRMQIDLLVNSFVNDMSRVATLQYTKSVGGARMNWLDINDNHHGLSHEPDKNEDAKEKLTKINTWFCEKLRYLVERLDNTPEPGGEGSLLDNTLIVWTNELGKGNNHTLNDIPFVLVGSAPGIRMGRSLKFKREAHNRLHLSLAHAMGHRIDTFGNKPLSEGGPLDLS